jgi:hypothetical protein
MQSTPCNFLFFFYNHKQVLPPIIWRNEVENMQVFETERLNVRWLEVSDAEFIFTLLNEPGWLQYIGDKGIRSIEDAHNYILSGPRSMYERLGFGLFVAELKDTHTPIGLCGLIKRVHLLLKTLSCPEEKPAWI